MIAIRVLIFTERLGHRLQRWAEYHLWMRDWYRDPSTHGRTWRRGPARA